MWALALNLTFACYGPATRLPEGNCSEIAFADAAQAGYLVAPAHMAIPGVGRLRVDGKSYRWQALPYVNDAQAVN